MKSPRKKRPSKAAAPSQPHPEHELSDEQLDGVAAGSASPKAPPTGQQPYLEYKFTNTFTTQINYGGGGPSVATESSPTEVSSTGVLPPK
jgi:hypothetical protein